VQTGQQVSGEPGAVGGEEALLMGVAALFKQITVSGWRGDMGKANTVLQRN
jgi:hypothetical protein